jgi:hypothetical protein
LAEGNAGDARLTMSAANPTTFLDLCQRTASECSVSLTGPASVVGQTGRLGQVVNWVQTSWGDIQTLHDDWFFMRSSFTVDTTSGDGEYAYGDCTDTVASAAISSFHRWVGDKGEECEVTPKIYLVSAGVATQTDLVFLDWRDFTAMYLIGTQTNSYPRHWTRSPSGKLLLGPKPDGIYRVTGDYQKAATALSGDSDEPELPAQYRMAIVYGAMMSYGRYNGAPEVFTDGQARYAKAMSEMRRTQRPRDLRAGPLA